MTTCAGPRPTGRSPSPRVRVGTRPRGTWVSRRCPSSRRCRTWRPCPTLRSSSGSLHPRPATRPWLARQTPARRRQASRERTSRRCRTWRPCPTLRSSSGSLHPRPTTRPWLARRKRTPRRPHPDRRSKPRPRPRPRTQASTNRSPTDTHRSLTRIPTNPLAP